MEDWRRIRKKGNTYKRNQGRRRKKKEEGEMRGREEWMQPSGRTRPFLRPKATRDSSTIQYQVSTRYYLGAMPRIIRVIIIMIV